jgi:excisionase family DNA binding protein
MPPESSNGININTKLAFTTEEAAALLSISEKTLYRLRARGLIRPMLATRHLLWPAKELQRFIEEVM